MSHIEAAVKGAKKIEAILRTRYSAEGRGLHEYLTDVEQRIPAAIVRKGRFIASVRNKVVHNDEEIFNLADFNRTVDEVVQGLNAALVAETCAHDEQARTPQLIYAGPRNRRNIGMQIIHVGPGRGHKVAARSPSGISKFLLVFLVATAGFLWFAWEGEKRKNDRAKIVMLGLKQELMVAKRELEESRLTPSSSMPPDQPLVAKSPDGPLILPSLSSIEGGKIDGVAAEKERPDLKAVQKRLNALGYRAGVPDGILGPTTTRALLRFESENELPVDGELSSDDRSLLFSEQAVGTQGRSLQGRASLLAKAQSSLREYEVARDSIRIGLVNLLRRNMRVTLGDADVSQATDGNFDVRIPVSWSISQRSVQSLLGRYFNGYRGKPLTSSGNRIRVDKHNADSSSAVRPDSGRLFHELLRVGLSIEVSLGTKSSSILVAGGFHCFVSCSRARNAASADAWIVQTSGKPGDMMLVLNQETPVVIEGVTEAELRSGEMPRAVVR